MNGKLEADIPTIADLLLVNLPDNVTLLPEDWEGKSKRACMRLTLSKQAIENEKFPLKAFVKSKFNNGLTVFRKKKKMEQLCMLRRMQLSIDEVSDKEVAIIHIYYEYAI